MTDADTPFSLVVLISGRGSNFKAILDAIRAGHLNAEIKAVISSRSDAAGLAYAREANIDILALEPADYPNREAYDRALQGLIDRFEPDMVVLAGFMRILSADFVHHYCGRMINIHPSLLPALRGLNTHQRALDEGLQEHGASVHFVTEELDGGPVIIQVCIPVLAEDDANSLAARVLQQEHRLYVQALRLLSERRVYWNGKQILYDNKPLQQPIQIDAQL
jgi:phosphoribosylglycinamide formyltransferase-1